MNLMPQITIIVPVYNAERTLERCVRSIQAQTVVNWELLLIDDGSEDYSSKLCDEYAIQDSRIRVFHQVNGGASSARNVGLEYTKGEWVVFCDSDDWVDSNWLELFKNQIDNGTELIVQGFIPHGNLWQSRTGINFHGNVKTGILKLQEENILGFMCTKMYKREIIEQCGLRFDTELVLREDELFMLQYAEYISTIQCMEEGAYHYLHSLSSLSFALHVSMPYLSDPQPSSGRSQGTGMSPPKSIFLIEVEGMAFPHTGQDVPLLSKCGYLVITLVDKQD